MKHFLLSEATAYVAKRPSAAKYGEALSQLSLSVKLRKALEALIRAPDHTLSVARINRIAGWKINHRNLGGVGLRIGWLGGRVAGKLGLQNRPVFPPRGNPEVRLHRYKTLAIAAEHWRNEKGKDVLYWMLYPEVAKALRQTWLRNGSHVESDERARSPREIPKPAIVIPRDNAAGWLSDAKERKIIEDHAMRAAKKFYRGRKFRSVKDVSESKPYDLEVRRETEIRHVEVKGTKTGGLSVILTAGEVKHAKDCSVPIDLFVLRNIVVNSGTGDAYGGVKQVMKNWVIDERRLSPTQYTYNLTWNHQC